MSAEITVSKTEAAWEQITTATKLYFEEGSLVAIHGLAASAVQVLSDLSKGTPNEEYNLLNLMIAPFSPEQQSEIIREFRTPQNFIKHADRDKDDSLTLSASHTELLLMCGVFLAGTVASEQYVNSMVEEPPVLFAYKMWFFISYPELLDSKFDQQQFASFLEELPKLCPIILPLSPNCTRSEFYEWFVACWTRLARMAEKWAASIDPNSILSELMSHTENTEFVSYVTWLFESKKEELASQQQRELAICVGDFFIIKEGVGECSTPQQLICTELPEL